LNLLKLSTSCLILFFTNTVDADINSASTVDSYFKEKNFQTKNGNWTARGTAIVSGKGNNSIKIAQIAAESKAKQIILEHICPDYDQSLINSVNIIGLTTISSTKYSDSYEVVLSAPVQKVKCELELKNKAKLNTDIENQKNNNKEKKIIDTDPSILKNANKGESKKLSTDKETDSSTKSSDSISPIKVETPSVQKYDTDY
jgi:hypothetical protein